MEVGWQWSSALRNAQLIGAAGVVRQQNAVAGRIDAGRNADLRQAGRVLMASMTSPMVVSLLVQGDGHRAVPDESLILNVPVRRRAAVEAGQQGVAGNDLQVQVAAVTLVAVTPEAAMPSLVAVLVSSSWRRSGCWSSSRVESTSWIPSSAGLRLAVMSTPVRGGLGIDVVDDVVERFGAARGSRPSGDILVVSVGQLQGAQRPEALAAVEAGQERALQAAEIGLPEIVPPLVETFRPRSLRRRAVEGRDRELRVGVVGVGCRVVGGDQELCRRWRSRR